MILALGADVLAIAQGLLVSGGHGVGVGGGALDERDGVLEGLLSVYSRDGSAGGPITEDTATTLLALGSIPRSHFWVAGCPSRGAPQQVGSWRSTRYPATLTIPVV